jgi:hypothetical protein
MENGNPAIRQGLIFGGIAAALSVVSTLIRFATGGAATTNPASVSGTLTGLGCVFFLITLALFLVAGMQASAQTGRTGTGAIAGLIAGVISGLAATILGIITILLTPHARLQDITQSIGANSGTQIPAGQLRAAIIIAAIIVYVFVILFELGLGAGLGALGGLIGRGRFQGPALPYQDQMYPGMQQPYPPYQQPYPQQPYPQQPYPPQGPEYPPQAPQYPPQYPPAPPYGEGQQAQYPETPQYPPAYPPQPPQYPQQER